MNQQEQDMPNASSWYAYGSRTGADNCTWDHWLALVSDMMREEFVFPQDPGVSPKLN
jgi:hypothetical protein